MLFLRPPRMIERPAIELRPPQDRVFGKSVMTEYIERACFFLHMRKFIAGPARAADENSFLVVVHIAADREIHAGRAICAEAVFDDPANRPGLGAANRHGVDPSVAR